MDLSTIFTVLISVAALSLSVVNYLRSRRDRELANELQAESLLDEAYPLLQDPKRVDEVALLVTRATKLAPNLPRVTLYRGYVHESEGRLVEAKNTIRPLLDVPDMERRACLELGRIGTGEERLHFYERAAACDPRRAAQPLCRLGQIHRQAGDPERAAPYLERSLAVNDNYAPAHVELGLVRERQGQIAEAKRHYERAISIDKSDVDALVSLGALYITHEDNWDEGLSWMQDAMHADPADPYPHGMLAAIHADRQEPEEALEHARRAAGLDSREKISDRETHNVMTAMRALLAERQSGPPETAG